MKFFLSALLICLTTTAHGAQRYCSTEDLPWHVQEIPHGYAIVRANSAAYCRKPWFREPKNKNANEKEHRCLSQWDEPNETIYSVMIGVGEEDGILFTPENGTTIYLAPCDSEGNIKGEQ